MKTILAALLAVVGTISCAGLASPCGSPNVVEVEGQVIDAAGKARAFDGDLCVEVEYCEDTISGCDPPNRVKQCTHVTADANGLFRARLTTSSPDAKDTIRSETFSLGPARLSVGKPTDDACKHQSLTFAVPR